MLGQVEEGGLSRRIPWGAAVAIAAALAALPATRGGATPPGSPPAAAPNVDGGAGVRPRSPLRTADLPAIHAEIEARRGKPLLVNFWAVWCAPCVEELPALATIESRFSRSGVRVLGVDCDLLLENDSPDLRARVASVLGKANVAYANLLYEGHESPLLDGFDLPGPLPVSILYAPDGTEARRWTGILPMKELEAALGSL